MLVGRTRRAVLNGAGILAVGIATMAFLADRSALAEVMRVSPDRFVAGLSERIMAVLADRSASAEQRLRRVDALVIESFDLDRIARIALGRYWKTATGVEQAEFAMLFKAYVLTGYGRRFNEYADRRLRVAGAKPTRKDVTVESYVEGGATPIRLDWRLTAIDGGWRVLDIQVEGVSLLITYRNDFAAVIERSGGRLSGLIDDLRGRVAAERTQLAS